MAYRQFLFVAPKDAKSAEALPVAIVLVAAPWHHCWRVMGSRRVGVPTKMRGEMYGVTQASCSILQPFHFFEPLEYIE